MFAKASSMKKGSRTSRDAALYDDEFYREQVDGSLQSARRYLSYLWSTLQPKSVLDVGCGRGTWLKSCHELGASRLLGLDGHWNSQSSMIDDAIEFRSIDLNKPFALSEKVELTICLEVAEHLKPKTGPQLVQCLTKSSNVILFSAAYLSQGGVDHINEREHSYWAKMFAAHDFFPFDLFRPVFWGEKDIDWWYRQNVFLYIRKDSLEWQRVMTAGHESMVNIDFMNCLHPDGKSLRFRSQLAGLLPSFLRAMRSRFVGVKYP
jgi:hypothetical protein